MSLNFPNVSRTYDGDGRRIRFWGHDAAMEVPFFLEEAALFRIDPKTRDAESDMLRTFDGAIDRIHEVAARAYAFGKKSFYVLTARDFS
jgi:hypothetical protein